MKQFLFLSVLLISAMICGTAFAADITGKYAAKEVSGEMVVTKSQSGYSVEIDTYDSKHPNPGFWSGFEGEGTLKNNILTVTQRKNDSSLQIVIKFTDNKATIADDDVKGDFFAFDGPSGGPGFAFTYKKK